MLYHCLKLNYIPYKWRQVKVVFIPKAGKASHSSPKDFRPISLSSFLLKTLERLIELYLKSIINPNMLSKAQHAYCKGKSTETALHSLVAQIDRSLCTTALALYAFHDIEGAFNNVTPTDIKTKYK